MPAFAPRYDDRIHLLVVALDDRSESLAEICRRVGHEAEGLGLPRPSYVHLRRLILRRRAAEDARREARRELLRIALEVNRDVTFGRRVDPWAIEAEVRDVLARRDRAGT